jgi:hypothetical protein
MRDTIDRQELERRRDRIRQELVSIGDLRPGSLVGRYRKCGKPNCHCATDEEGGHGPSWSLTRRVGGKTVTRVIPASAVAQTQQQIAEYQRLRTLVGEIVEVNEGICEALLAAPGAHEEGKKGGTSKRPSTRKSPPSSKHS